MVFLLLAFPFGALARADRQPATVQVDRAGALPLALEPGAFEFRKTKLYFLESLRFTRAQPNEERSIAFERKRLLYGAITPNDERDRYGNYFTFFWRANRRADLVVRLEYRQQRLGPFVQAREVAYPGALGSFHTEFQVTGDDYLVDGRVTEWRVLLVERAGAPPGTNSGRIVALGQSYLWR
ncbi:MAG: hypothetical protein JO295_07240 [Verrucomicrobia bacterium]|nr:hypothetical protein [Verrucomicrobiota bacterium]